MKTRSGILHTILPFIGSVLSVLLLSFAAFMFVILACNAEQRTDLLRKANKLNLENTVYYENVDSWIMTSKEIAEEDQRIAMLEDVAHVSRIAYLSTVEKNHDISLALLQYSNNDVVRSNTLISGKYFGENAYNQVLLSDTFKGVFQEGDRITVYFFVASDVDLNSSIISLELTIMGFLQKQPVLSASAGGNGVALQQLLKYDSVGIVSILQDDSGQILSGTASDYCLIYPKSGVEMAPLLKEIQKTVASPANVVTGRQVIDRYLEANAAEFRELVGLFFLCLLLGVTLVWGRMIILESSEERSLVIRYLCGSTWGRETFLLFLPIFIEVIVSLFLGMLLYLLLEKQESAFLSISLNAAPKHFIFASSVMLLLYLFSLLPIYFEAARKSPISLYRRD